MNTLSCNVGLFQPKTFQVPVTDLYIFIKVHSEIGPVMHVLRTGCHQNPSASPADLAGWPTRPERIRDLAAGAGRAVVPGGPRRVTAVGEVCFGSCSARSVQNVQNSLHL